MANDLTKNPIILDTAGAVLADWDISINSVQWVNPTTVGHTVTLVDTNGNTVFKATCVVANQSLIKYFRPGFVFTGLNVSALDSGEIHVLTNWMKPTGTRNKPWRD